MFGLARAPALCSCALLSALSTLSACSDSRAPVSVSAPRPALASPAVPADPAPHAVAAGGPTPGLTALFGEARGAELAELLEEPRRGGPMATRDYGNKTDRDVPRYGSGEGGLSEGARVGSGALGLGVGRSGGSGTRGSGAGSRAGYGAGEGGLGVESSGSGARSPLDRLVPPPAAGGTFVHAGTNPIVSVAEDPLSTFAVDVDTGSYFYARRFLELGRAPDSSSVRVEEWVNALGYAYAPPSGDEAFAIHLDAAPSPFSRGLHIVRVALKGKQVSTSERKPAHVVFLVDVSGSMRSDDKLPWAKRSMRLAVEAMRPDDSVAIVTYAGATGVALATTTASHKDAIFAAIERLAPGGGTDLGSGMELAYREATKELSSGRSARVIVLSDGDANIGRTSHPDIVKSIKGYVSEGVTLSTIGYGSGNYNDHLMEQLADAGNGTYTYINHERTMKRAFQDELTSTLEVIAQDVKIQVEWNKDAVESYRLLGYENRDVKDADFRNDKKDAGEIGAGHAVTALYEVRLARSRADDVLATVRVRAKAPRGTRADEVSRTLLRGDLEGSTRGLDADARAALGVAVAAEILRGSSYAHGLRIPDAAALLRGSATGPFASERRELADVLEKVPAAAVARR